VRVDRGRFTPLLSIIFDRSLGLSTAIEFCDPCGGSRLSCTSMHDSLYEKSWLGVSAQGAPTLAIRVAPARGTGHKSVEGAALAAPQLETIMTHIAALHPILRAWLLEGPLAAQDPAYVDRLKRGRYAAHTCVRCLNGAAHFAHRILGRLHGGLKCIGDMQGTGMSGHGHVKRLRAVAKQAWPSSALQSDAARRSPAPLRCRPRASVVGLSMRSLMHSLMH
jgi:hypothetical protein